MKPWIMLCAFRNSSWQDVLFVCFTEPIYNDRVLGVFIYEAFSGASSHLHDFTRQYFKAKLEVFNFIAVL